MAAQVCPIASFAIGERLPFETYSGSGHPFGLVDLNGDGRPDLVWIDEAGVRVSLNLGGGTYGSPRIVAAGGNRSVFGDFNGDGTVDLVLSRGQDLVLLLGDGTGAFQESGPINAGIPVSSFVTGDFDGDGALDIAGTSASAHGFAVLRGDGRGHFREPVFTHPDVQPPIGDIEGWENLVAVDLNHDGRTDLVWFRAILFGASCGIELANGDGTFRPGNSPMGGWRTSYRVTPADVDGDGNTDLIFQHAYEYGPFRLYVDLLDRSGAVRSSVSSGPTVSAYGLPIPNLAVADFNGDGLLDIAFVQGASIVNPSPVRVAVARGDGAGAFGEPVSFPAQEGTVFAADVDGDGRPDIVIGPSSGSPPRWYRNTCGTTGIERTLVVPALLSAPGAAGAFYESDLTITNSGSTMAHVDLTYTPVIGGGGGTGTATIPPGSQLWSSSAFELLARVGVPVPGSGPRVGTLRARFTGLASPHAAAINVRTSSSGAGTSYPGIEPPPYQTQRISWLAQDAQDRSNLGLMNAGTATDGDVTLRITVVSTDPSRPGSSVLPDVRLSPGASRQIDRILEVSGLDASSGLAEVERVEGTAAFVSWGVVNDQVSSDGSFAYGEPFAFGEPLFGSDSHLISSVVETPAYRTELVLSNPALGPVDVWLTYRLGGDSGDTELLVTVPPNSTWRSSNVVDLLRNAADPGLPPSGTSIAGAVLVQSPYYRGLGMAARVVRDAGVRGRYGVLLPDRPSGAPGPRVGWIPDLRQDGSSRTNLVLLDPLGRSASYRVQLFTDSGQEVASRNVDLPSPGWVQINGILGSWAPGVSRGWARISRLDEADAAFAYAVINDGSAPGLGTGDGSIVSMEKEP